MVDAWRIASLSGPLKGPAVRCPLSAFAPNSFSLLSRTACAPTGVNVWVLCPNGIEGAARARRGRLGGIGGGSSQFERRRPLELSRFASATVGDGNRCEGLSV